MIMDANKPGVYAIWRTETDARYIGSSARRIAGRWADHRSALRRGKHRNTHLQNAWNKYGEPAFQFVVLENCASEDVLDTEQRWYDHFKALDTPLYNKREHVDSQLGFKHSAETCARMRIIGQEQMRDPVLREIRLDTLRRARASPVSQAKRQKSMRRFWSDAMNRKAKGIPEAFTIVDPNGVLHIVVNLSDFCRERGLDVSTLHAVIRGDHSHHKGWRRLDPGQEPTPFTGTIPARSSIRILTSPDGTTYRVTNLQAFCREHGLYVVAMREVCQGRQIEHRGWRGIQEGYQPKTDNKRDATRHERCFIAPDGTVQVTDNLSQFCKSHNLDKGAMLRLEAGKVKSHKGWTR